MTKNILTKKIKINVKKIIYLFSFALYNIKQLIVAKINIGEITDTNKEIFSVLPKTYEKLFK